LSVTVIMVQDHLTIS